MNFTLSFVLLRSDELDWVGHPDRQFVTEHRHFTNSVVVDKEKQE